ncbi:DUF3515 domain-containing protein [Cellulomonas aerilata]|uniref:Uncharacterized protein n=1 Tax=Cellulomonas aerilata TaxID=515326 RepID=A0A512DH05_9CELL|nr:DUF3515 domain-containing protein [Cellulomonas aerilata]GEO35763.1 hypothetical protein CAE01nite_34880 [Cellulomonas aerilata]
MPPASASVRARPSARRWTTPASVGVGVGLTLLAGCSSAVSVGAAPFAGDPVCAQVVLALPDELGVARRTETTSQATAAWTDGDARDAIVLRCGVEPLPPTTDQCVTATDESGTSVDWVTVPGDEAAGTPWTFTTYGRLPAVEVTVPTSVTSERSTSFLVDLGRAIAHTEQVRQCL